MGEVRVYTTAVKVCSEKRAQSTSNKRGGWEGQLKFPPLLARTCSVHHTSRHERSGWYWLNKDRKSCAA